MNYIEEYNSKIQKGEINACEKLKKVYAHLVENINNNELLYKYDNDKAIQAIDFIENFCIIPKMRGTPKFKLELWQKALVSAAFGFINKETGMRQYREIFLFVGRKNAKSVLSAAIAIYLLLIDGEDAPEVYSAATDRQQAKIIWEYAKIMISRNKTLKKYLKSKVNLIECQSNTGKFIPLSKNSGSLDGLNVSAFLCDELHSIKDRNMYDVLKGGTYARQQPLTLITSTGGYVEQDSIFDTKYQEYTAIISGYSDKKYIDETTLPIIYELDSKKEVTHKANWIKANPNLSISKSIEQLETEVKKATLNEKTMRDLLVKQFNFRENAKDSFFELEQIVNKEKFNLTEFTGCYFCGGVDLSETQDLTCASALFYKENKIYVHQMYWIPRETLDEHMAKDKVPYDLWIENDYLRTCEGNSIDQRVVTAWFMELQEEYNCYAYKIGYDAFNAQYLTKDLEETFGKSLTVKINQNFKGLSCQMYESKAWFKEKRIIYNYNPVFLWCLCNTQAVTDTQGNVKPYKNRNEHKRIDGYSSFLDAFCVFLDNQNDLI